MLNKQIPTKQVQVTDGSLLVHSVFATIQGEGIFAGEPCVFIRLGGCNLQCPACDTEYTDGATPHTLQETLERINAELEKIGTNGIEPLVVITGGEPMRQRIGRLVRELNLDGVKVQIETNGTLFDDTIDFSTRMVYIMCSPKTGAVNKKLQPHITAYKYVGGCNERDPNNLFFLTHLEAEGIELEDHGLLEDGLPRQALGHTAKPHLARPPHDFTGKVYLQPIDRQDDRLNNAHRNAVVQACINHGYTLCLQIHKIIDVE